MQTHLVDDIFGAIIHISYMLDSIDENPWFFGTTERRARAHNLLHWELNPQGHNWVILLRRILIHRVSIRTIYI